ncbi:golgin subfamily B member 1 [Xyrauchen texanus]|uniref:golgin subfamily B member 1 n=1 Tax=Xyrauchen texanus TaxID=154827 RepID=UPI002242B499|nr:golgin subfamily B member 1 [Xyrauchen texanus]
MLKWFSADEGGSAHGAPGSPQVDAGVNAPTLSEVTERLAQMEELVTQLKELIREKDAALCSKDERLKVERDSYESKLSKIRLQNKAKVTSLNSQLEELRKNQERKEQGSPARTKQSGTGEAGDSESAAANRGKILRLRKKVEDLEQQVAQRDQELKQKIQELEAQRERGSAVDAMLADRAKLLTEKEAYIVHLQTALSGEQPVPQQSNEGSVNELNLMVQSLTKKVGDGEERCSLLQEQVDSFRELLMSKKTQFEEKENMYKSNIQTFKDIILQKDNTLMEIRQTHEQELFKLVAKSDASADLEQLLTALKQKLHEKEEVLLGKTQVIDVLQVEVDGRDQQIKELTEQMQHLQRERENLQSKLEAERHIARARLRDLMEKHEAELHRAAEKHNSEMSEKEQALRIQLETLQRSTAVPSDVPANPPTCITAQRITELEAHAKLKADEASKAEAKFLKMKAWSKARIRQLEEEFRKVQSGICTNMSPDVMSLRSRVTELEEEREEMFCKLELYEEMKAKNDELQKQLVEYEEQQRKMQADLEQVTKRAASQASETGSMDDFQNQVMEWQEMVTMVMESEGVRDQGHEKHAMSFRMSQIEEEREGLIEDDWLFPGCSDPALAKRQQDVEEELAQAHGLHPQKSRKHKHFTPRSLQEDLEFDNRQSFPDPKDPTGCDVFMDGENMGGWWPKHGAADTDGLRSVVEELELERNQLQEQILGLEERCQDLEDRLQLQARIELLQNELERLQVQVTSLRSQQVKDAEKHQLLVTSLNEQLKGLNSTQECLESSLIEKEHTLAKTSEKLECIDTLREALRSKEKQHKDTAEKLLQTEHNLADVMKKCSIFEKENSQMKATVAELTQKISVQKDKMQKQEATIESLQSDLVQTNDELDRLNIAHLEERAQLIHDMQSCERRIDSLKDIITDKDKEILALSSSTTEYSEQIHELKQQIKLKEAALANVEPEVQTIRDPQHSDQQSFNTLIAELMEQLKKTESDLNVAKIEGESKSNDIIGLMKQIEEDKKTIQDLRMDVQKLNMNQKDQLFDSELMLEKELKSLKEERNKLLAEVTKHESELQTLSRELEEKFACQEPLKQDVQEKSKMIFSLEQRLQIVQEEAEGERTRYSTEIKTRDETNEQLVKELSGTNENITKMKDHIESLQNDNQKLKDSLEENFDELEKQKQLLDNVKKEMHAVQDQNSSLLLQVKSLTDENCQLKQIIETGSQSFEEKNILLNKISELELELLGSKKTVEDLCKEKEDLTLRGAELKKELEQSKQSMSEMLLEKSNECSQHSALLRESGEMISSLQVQVESLNNQVNQSNSCMSENERTIAEKNELIESQKCQLLQLQEALSRFQEQEATLKSELVEKDGTMKSLKEECNQLTTAVTKQKSEIHNISKEFEEQVASQEQLKQDVQEKSKKILSLEQKLKIVQEEAEGERTRYSTEIMTRDEAMEKLEKELSVKNGSIIKMKAHFKSLKNDKQKLKESLEENFEELEKQKQLLDNVKKEMHAVQDQNSSLLLQVKSLTDENCQLKQIVETGSQSLSEVLEEKNILLDKISEAELELLGSKKTVEDLCKEKEDLTLRGAELKKELEQSKQSMSEMLLEKSNECSQHSALLRESGEMISSLQVQVESLNNQVDQSNSCMSEKERTLDEKNALIESQKCQLIQLQMALTRFQEQEATLKSELVEKDGTMKSLKEECNQLTTAVTKQKSEIHNISKEFEEQVASQEQLKQDAQEKSKKILSLEQKLKIVQEKAEGERSRYSTEIMTRDEAMEKLEKELSGKNESISKMKAHFKSLKNDNQKCKDSLEENFEELEKQKQLLDNVKKEMHAVQDQNSSLLLQVKCLTDENYQLKQIIETGSQSLHEVLEEKNILLDKISEVELELLGSKKTVEELQKEKEDLTLRGAELKKELEQSKQSMSEMLLEKSNECSQHSALLKESGEMISSLQVQVESLNNQVDQSNSCMAENERTIAEKNALIESQKCQLLQLQEALTRFQEQEATLKSELVEKDGTMNSLKEECNQLTTAVTKQKSEIHNISKEFEEQVASQEQLKQDVQEKSKKILSLEQKLKIVQEEAEGERSRYSTEIKTRDEAMEKLEKELSVKNGSIIKIKAHFKSLKNDNQKLKESLEENLGEFVRQKQLLDNAKEDMLAVQDQSSCLLLQVKSLTEDNCRLKQIIENGSQSLSDVSEEKTILLAKISEVELQLLESVKTIEGLCKEKEDLTLRGAELKKELEQNKQSMSEMLLEKSNECSQHSALLRESGEMISSLQVQVESLNNQVNQSNSCMVEKDNTIGEKNALIDSQKCQILQLQETMTQLNELEATLKSELMEKDGIMQVQSAQCTSLQSELQQQRQYLSKVQSEFDSLKNECTQLTGSLQKSEDRTRECQTHTDELRERSESVALLSEQLAAVNKINVRLESEIMAMKTAHDILFSDKNKLEEELSQIQAGAVRFHDHVHLNSQNQQLQAMFEGKEKEVLLLTQVVSETNNKLAITTKENENLASQVVSLCEQNKNLQEQTSDQTKSLTEMTKETNTLQNKISILETQDVENSKIIEDLFKHMEGLLLQAEELKVFKQKQQSGAESLQEMSSECAALSKRLGEAEEEVALLKGELESSSSQIIHYSHVVLEKDKILNNQSTQMEAYQHQLEHLHKTLSILQEQANAHNSGLIEKDVLLQKESSSCSLLQKELGHERELVLNLQHEIESLKVECSRLNQSLEAQHSSLREKTLESHNHKEELVKRNEYVLSLTAQLGIMNENNVKLKSENANLKCALERHSKESARLKEELRQKQLELVEHQDITEQNNTIKSELKSSMAELFGQQEMIATLQSELATRNEKLASLKEQIETEHSGNDVLQLTLQEKEAALRAQEMHVNKLQDKLLESEGQIRQKIKVISELQEAAQSFQTALQDKDVLLLNKEQEFSLVKTELMAESEACKAQLKLEMDTVATLQGDLQNLLEKNKHLMSVVDEKDFLMRQEQEKYLCLQGSAAELENTKSQLNGQIKKLTLEATQLRETQTEKEQVVFAAQSQMQKLDELYKKLQEEYNLTKQELYKVINEKSLKEEEVCKLALEKEEISRNSSLQIQRIQEQVQHNQQQSVTMNDMEEEIKMEREQLHIQESMWGTDVSPEHWVQLHSHLQRSQLEIQQRDFGLQQLNIKLQQAIEEKTGVSAQLSTVSQMFRDTQETVSELQNRCYWLERQSQIQYSAVQQGSVSTEVPPGAPQERVSALHIPDASDSRDLRIRLTEAELHLSQLNSRLEEERSRREAAEEAVRLTKQRVTSMESNTSWSSQRDFSIEMETDEEQYEALILDPNQHLLMRKMKSGVHLCRRWLKGRSTYCSKLLTSRAKSRYVFMAYLLTLHVLVFMCLSGAL